MQLRMNWRTLTRLSLMGLRLHYIGIADLGSTAGGELATANRYCLAMVMAAMVK